MTVALIGVRDLKSVFIQTLLLSNKVVRFVILLNVAFSMAFNLLLFSHIVTNRALPENMFFGSEVSMLNDDSRYTNNGTFWNMVLESDTNLLFCNCKYFRAGVFANKLPLIFSNRFEARSMLSILRLFLKKVSSNALSWLPLKLMDLNLVLFWSKFLSTDINRFFPKFNCCKFVNVPKAFDGIAHQIKSTQFRIVNK
jgi:hypothetical protein